MIFAFVMKHMPDIAESGKLSGQQNIKVLDAPWGAGMYSDSFVHV